MLTPAAARTLSVSSTRLTFAAKTGTFAAELSDFGQIPLPLNVRVRSAKTGREVEFRGARPNRDPEGEIVSWSYTAQVDGRTLKVVLFND